MRFSLNRALPSSLVNSLSQRRLARCRAVARRIRLGTSGNCARRCTPSSPLVPHDRCPNHRIERHPGRCATVFVALPSGFGPDPRPEEAPSRGNLDPTGSAPGRIVQSKCETVPGRQGSGRAVRQLQARGYADHHLAGGEPAHRVGVEFSLETRNVALVEWETVGGAEAASADAAAAASPH